MNLVKKPLAILMADDDPDDRLITKEAFEECHVLNDLVFVEDGVELTDYLFHRGKYSDVVKFPLPGIILLDLNMPRKNGIEALEEIKKNEELRKIPVIILTTSKAEEDILKSYNLGANSFITKPVSFERLTEIVKILKEYWFEIVILPD